MGRRSPQPPVPREDDAADGVDRMIRRRFRSCESLPLFPEPPPQHQRLPGFFEASEFGAQLRLVDLNRPHQCRVP